MSDLIGYAALLGFLAAIGYLVSPIFQFGFEGSTDPSGASQIVRAAIIDQLSSIRRDSTLLPSATRMLSARGIPFDVFLPGDVTVPFYARLPTRGYGLIILRVHTGLGDPNSDVPIGLFTNEPYDPNRYVVEQAAGLVGAAQASEGSQVVFAVTPKFIRETMRGKFADAIIVLGGCYGLQGSELAQAFVDKGARVVVGWTGLVDLSHTDKALKQFLEEFLVNRKTVHEAVETTMRTVGPDPFFKSELDHYPTNQGSITITASAPILTVIPQTFFKRIFR